LKAQEISAMTKCPRCNLEQEESDQCRYCGLVFEEFRESKRASKVVRPKRAMVFAIILVLIGALITVYLLVSYQDKPGQKLSSVERSSDLAQRAGDNDLRKAAKELTGDVGIVKGITGGYTKGSIVAMVIFSIIGLGYLTYGKKSRQLLMLICGIALMGYSYFVDDLVYIILIVVGLIALPFILSRK
jgi:hypothetical protein